MCAMCLWLPPGLRLSEPHVTVFPWSHQSMVDNTKLATGTTPQHQVDVAVEVGFSRHKSLLLQCIRNELFVDVYFSPVVQRVM